MFIIFVHFYQNIYVFETKSHFTKSNAKWLVQILLHNIRILAQIATYYVSIMETADMFYRERKDTYDICV